MCGDISSRLKFKELFHEYKSDPTHCLCTMHSEDDECFVLCSNRKNPRAWSETENEIIKSGHDGLLNQTFFTRHVISTKAINFPVLDVISIRFLFHSVLCGFEHYQRVFISFSGFKDYVRHKNQRIIEDFINIQ